jgi:hypothetical protein
LSTLAVREAFDPFRSKSVSPVRALTTRPWKEARRGSRAAAAMEQVRTAADVVRFVAVAVGVGLGVLVVGRSPATAAITDAEGVGDTADTGSTRTERAPQPTPATATTPTIPVIARTLRLRIGQV